SAIGRHLPAHATALGKTLLAERGPDDLDERLPDPLPRLTRHTIVDRTRLADELAEIRARGYAIDHEENTDGIVCVARALPVRVPATDAISLSVPAARMDADRIEQMAAALARAVEQVRAARSLLA